MVFLGFVLPVLVSFPGYLLPHGLSGGGDIWTFMSLCLVVMKGGDRSFVRSLALCRRHKELKFRVLFLRCRLILQCMLVVMIGMSAV